MANYTLGIDVSRNQGEMDFGKAHAAGARFVFVRAGSVDSKTGIPYADYQLERNARLAPCELLTGYYWFFRPQFEVPRQIWFFYNLTKDKAMGLPLVLDVEIEGPKLAVHVRTALECLEQLTGRLPMVYTRGEFWNTNMGLVYWAKKYPLHIARYPEVDTSLAPHPWKDKAGKVLTKVKPLGWEDWAFWQHSADENRRGHEFGSNPLHGSHAIDLDWFNGDEAALLEFSRRPYGDKPQPEPTLGWKEAIDAWARTQGYKGPRP